jgi:hypothetical protein
MKMISHHDCIMIISSKYILYMFTESVGLSIDYIFPNYNDISIWILSIDREIRLKQAKFCKISMTAGAVIGAVIGVITVACSRIWSLRKVGLLRKYWKV